MMYEKGEGVKQNYTEAFNWYKLAAKNGNADAQYNLAMLYYEGKGICKNDKEAFKWLQEAAAKGL